MEGAWEGKTEEGRSGTWRATKDVQECQSDLLILDQSHDLPFRALGLNESNRTTCTPQVPQYLGKAWPQRKTREHRKKEGERLNVRI